MRRHGDREQDHGQVGTQQPAPRAAGGKPRPRRRWLWLVLLLVVAFVASFYVFRVVVPTVPYELVGTWRVVDGDMKGATLEFHWDGTGYAAMDKQGKKEVAESSVKVRGKRIYMTYKGGMPGLPDTVIQTILKLSDDELIIRDQDERVYNLVRISR
jgi:uncharacterized protein (TIGR03066 family)